MIYSDILKNKSEGRTQVAVLIDPDKYCENSLEKLVSMSENHGVSMFFVGGSLINSPFDETISMIKQLSDIPVVIFPGSTMQLSVKADGILFLSLISGRNAEFLIGNHVNAATYIRQSNMEVISTGYMLIESGKATSVEYMSNTKPIPADKIEIAVATAQAGEMLGNQLIYLEAGSGAKYHVSIPMIESVKKSISIPLIVGGGITTPEAFEAVKNAGADLIVLGNILEKDPEFLNNIL